MKKQGNYGYQTTPKATGIAPQPVKLTNGVTNNRTPTPNPVKPVTLKEAYGTNSALTSTTPGLKVTTPTTRKPVTLQGKIPTYEQTNQIIENAQEMNALSTLDTDTGAVTGARLSNGVVTSDVDNSVDETLNTGYSGLDGYKNLSLEERYQKQYDQINANYDAQISDLEWSKMTSQQQADITRAQLRKYLPYYYKSRGLDGLGLEQSAMLEANANYSNQMGQIETDYMQEKNALENYRTTALADKENEYYQEFNANSSNAYEEISTALERYIFDEKLTDEEYEKIKDTLEVYRHILNEQDLKASENLLENYRINYGEDEEETETTKTDTLTDAMKKGNEFVIINGKKYLLAQYASGEVITYKNGKHSKLDEEMRQKGYASMYDKNIPYGTLYQDEYGLYAFLDGEWYFIYENIVNEKDNKNNWWLGM